MADLNSKISEKMTRTMSDFNYIGRQLDRVVSMAEEEHHVLSPRTEHQFTLVPGTIYYFQLPLKGQPSPLRVFFKPKEGRPDLEIYLGREMHPDEDHCLKASTGQPITFCLPEHQKQIFETDCLYLSVRTKQKDRLYVGYCFSRQMPPRIFVIDHLQASPDDTLSSSESAHTDDSITTEQVYFYPALEFFRHF